MWVYNAKMLLLSVVSAVDNFSVGLTYSLAHRQLSHLQNAVAALANCLTSLVTMLLGSWISNHLDADVASTLGASVFIVLGLKELVTGFVTVSSKEEPEGKALIADGNKPPPAPAAAPVEWWEALGLAAALCLTNVAGGIAAGLAGYSPELFSILVLLSSFLLLLLGQKLGGVFGRVVPENSVSIISGVCLILLGISNIPYLNLPSSSDL